MQSQQNKAVYFFLNPGMAPSRNTGTEQGTS